jgi:hypothetical protein
LPLSFSRVFFAPLFVTSHGLVAALLFQPILDILSGNCTAGATASQEPDGVPMSFSPPQGWATCAPCCLCAAAVHCSQFSRQNVEKCCLPEATDIGWTHRAHLLPGSESGACLVGLHSPRSLPFAHQLRSGSPRFVRRLHSRARTSSATVPHLPDAGRKRQRRSGQTRDLLASDTILLHVMWPSTPAGRQHLAQRCRTCCFRAKKNLSACDIYLSWLNPTPCAIAVCASQPPSPVTTQHSLPSGRYSYLGGTCIGWIAPARGWRTYSITSSACASNVEGTSMPSVLAVRRLMTSSKLVAR